jgi:hypothetical protein
MVMRTLGIIVASLVTLIVLLIGGTIAWVKLVAYPDYSYRYRLTLSIEAEGKVHTGSSVIEVVWNGGIPFGDVGPYVESRRGQATVIDLGKRGAVVAVLVAPSHTEGGIAVWPEGTDVVWLASRAFGAMRETETLPLQERLARLTRLTGRRDLAPDNMPRLIWFSDVADPKTARLIRPADVPNLFGAGARITDAYVEITRDPIVINIDKKLPWYKALRAPPNDGVMYLPNGFALGWTMFIGDGS